MIYINNEEKINRINLQKDNFYIIADFDKTITRGDSVSTWGAVANANTLGDEYTKKRTALYNKYRPIEIDVSIPDEEKCKYMSEWFWTHMNMFYEFDLKEDDLNNAMKKSGLKYRDGAKKFLKDMNELQIPFIIISAGIGNIIEKFLKMENDYFDNIKIVSNFLEFENGKIKPLGKDVIHSYNKNIVELDSISREKLSSRKNIVLFGDSVGDLKMLPKGNIQNAITVGFLDEKIEENLKTYNENFDIVITDNGSFEEINNVIFKNLY